MPKRFWWWDLEDLVDDGFFERITRVGAENLRLEFHPEREDSLCLIDTRTDEVCGSYNYSHSCPPDCE